MYLLMNSVLEEEDLSSFPNLFKKLHLILPEGLRESSNGIKTGIVVFLSD